MGFGCGARVVPHLSGPLDPLVGDPLVAEADRTAEVEDPRVVAADRVVVEPVQRTSGFRLKDKIKSKTDFSSFFLQKNDKFQI
jgi:hypothetical protein